MNNEDSNNNEEILLKLDMILFWLKVANFENAKVFLENILDTEQKREAFQLTDGSNTINAIMNSTGVKSTSTISNWWNDWMIKGIVRESKEHPGRKEKLIDLSELGY